MKITHETEGTAAIFTVCGQVDMHTSPELRGTSPFSSVRAVATSR